jgi:hypothetical protein
MQISQAVLDEYNEYLIKNSSRLMGGKIHYDTSDLFDADINRQVGRWYLFVRIPQMLEHYKLADTLENRLICYNFGIGNLIKYRQGKIKLPKETRNYLLKYYKLAQN